MTDIEFKKVFNEVVSSLIEKGYNPYEQILGYLEMDSDIYITRHGNARDKIKLLDKEKLKAHIKTLK